MTSPAYLNSPGASGTEAVAPSQPPLERPAPMARSVQPKHPRKRPHHGTAARQLDALDRLATETAAELAAIKAALVVQGILVLAEPAAAKPQRPALSVLPGGRTA